MTTPKSTWTPWTIGIVIIGSLIVFAPHILECSGEIVQCSYSGVGGVFGVMLLPFVAAFLGAKTKSVAKLFSKNTFHQSFAFLFLLSVMAFTQGHYSNNSSEHTEFMVWLEGNASQEDRSFASELQQQLYTSTISDKEASRYIDLLLDFFEHRGITRDEFKQNREDALKIIRQMYGDFADYQLEIANSMLKSWDNRHYEFTSTTGKSFSAAVPLKTEDLLSLVEEVKMFNPILGDKVEIDMKMIEFAARRQGTFFVAESVKEISEYMYALAAVPPKQDPSNDKVYKLNREIIISRLRELEQFKKNIEKINDALETWLQG